MKQLISLFVLLLIIWIGCDDKTNIEKPKTIVIEVLRIATPTVS